MSAGDLLVHSTESGIIAERNNGAIQVLS